MKHTKTQRVITVISAMIFSLAVQAADHDHHGHDGHDESTMKLKLNNGKKWTSDKPLRENMSQIHEHVKSILPKVTSNTAKDADYKKVSKSVETNIHNIFNTCKLPKEADAQLHIVMAELMAANKTLAGKTKLTEKKKAFHKMIASYKSYLKHFEGSH